jgi:hypothetical protein
MTKIQIIPRICVCDTHEYSHEKSFDELTFQNTILNLRILHEDINVLKTIHKIKVLNQEIILDFNAMTASYGWTTNPLYSFSHEKKMITEISIYNFKQVFESMKNQEIEQLICVFDKNENNISYEINHLNEIKLNFTDELLLEKKTVINGVSKSINQYLKTWVDKDFDYINIEAENDFFIFFQYVIGGEFFEVEKSYSKGKHRIKLEHKPSHYFGICFNMPINSFIDYDHKHIIYGQLGVSSVKVLHYNNELFYAYLSNKFLYQQCLNVINNIEQIKNPQTNTIAGKTFNYSDNYIGSSLLSNISNEPLLINYLNTLNINYNSVSFEVNTIQEAHQINNLLSQVNIINKDSIYFYITFVLNLSHPNEEQIKNCLDIEKQLLQVNNNIIYKTNMTFSLFNEELKTNIEKLNQKMNDKIFSDFFNQKNFIEKAWLNNNVNTQENYYEVLKTSSLSYYGFSYTRNKVSNDEINDTIIQRNILDNQKRIFKGCINCPYYNNTCQYAMSFPVDKKKTTFIYFNDGLSIDSCHYKKIVKQFKNHDE